jgi:hypothetical protein
MQDKDRVQKLISQGLMYIDATDCGSTIAWRVADSGWEGKSNDCSVQLTDCSRMIVWHVECDKRGVKKLENAIACLQDALSATIKTMHIQDKKIAQEEKEKKRLEKKKKKQP